MNKLRDTKVKIDSSVDRVAKCPCGLGISFGPMAERMIVGLSEAVYEEYLAAAPIINWPLAGLADKIDMKALHHYCEEMEDHFYHCKCGRLLWRKANTDEVLVFAPDKGELK